MTGHWTLEYVDEGVKHIHLMSNKINAEGVNRTLNIQFQRTPMSTHTDMLRIIGEQSLKNDELKKEIAALEAKSVIDDSTKYNQADQISSQASLIGSLNRTIGIRGKEIVELRKSVQARTATIAEQKKELDALQWASVMGYPPVSESEAEEKVKYLEKELTYKDEQVAELRKLTLGHSDTIAEQKKEISELQWANNTHKKAWVDALTALAKFTKLKPVGTFNSIERSFERDKTFIILDGQFTLYEVKE
jgi:hypothetical protein